MVVSIGGEERPVAQGNLIPRRRTAPSIAIGTQLHQLLCTPKHVPCRTWFQRNVRVHDPLVRL